MSSLINTGRLKQILSHYISTIQNFIPEIDLKYYSNRLDHRPGPRRTRHYDQKMQDDIQSQRQVPTSPRPESRRFRHSPAGSTDVSSKPVVADIYKL